MNDALKDRILRRLDTLSDERAYQILDYVEFLESKYAERQAPAGNFFTKFTEGVEDTLRAGRVSASAISETMSLLNKAATVFNGVAAAGKSVANDVINVASRAGTEFTNVASSSGSAGAPGSTPTNPANIAPGGSGTLGAPGQGASTPPTAAPSSPPATPGAPNTPGASGAGTPPTTGGPLT
jgi:hypothetical protein